MSSVLDSGGAGKKAHWAAEGEKEEEEPRSKATGWANTMGLLSVMRTASLSEEPLISSCRAFLSPIRVRKYATWWKSEPASS